MESYHGIIENIILLNATQTPCMTFLKQTNFQQHQEKVSPLIRPPALQFTSLSIALLLCLCPILSDKVLLYIQHEEGLTF